MSHLVTIRAATSYPTTMLVSSSRAGTSPTFAVASAAGIVYRPACAVVVRNPPSSSSQQPAMPFSSAAVHGWAGVRGRPSTVATPFATGQPATGQPAISAWTSSSRCPATIAPRSSRTTSRTDAFASALKSSNVTEAAQSTTSSNISASAIVMESLH